MVYQVNHVDYGHHHELLNKTSCQSWSPPRSIQRGRTLLSCCTQPEVIIIRKSFEWSVYDS